MATHNKKWWIIHCSAGVVTAILLTVGITQCTGKLSEREQKEAAKRELVNAGRKIDGIANKVDSLLNANNGLREDNNAKADTIRMQRDTIIAQRDSIANLQDSLADCRNGKKRCPVKPVPVKKPVVKPTPVKPTPVKPSRDTLVVIHENRPVVRDTANCGGATIVKIGDGASNNGVLVNGGCQNNGTSVTIGNNSNGNVVTVNNGTINYYNGNPADSLSNAADTLARYGVVQMRMVRTTKTRIK